MRDRRARLGMVLLVLCLPYLIDAMSSGRRAPETVTGFASLSAAALFRFGSNLSLEMTEVVVLSGLFYAGWQRRRLLDWNLHH